jgi:hypothetical protein
MLFLISAKIKVAVIWWVFIKERICCGGNAKYKMQNEKIRLGILYNKKTRSDKVKTHR